MGLSNKIFHQDSPSFSYFYFRKISPESLRTLYFVEASVCLIVLILHTAFSFSYDINKNDFRNLVQQLTGSPLREPPFRPTQYPPKPPNKRLQRIHPPTIASVAPINRTQIPILKSFKQHSSSSTTVRSLYQIGTIIAPNTLPTGFSNLISPQSPYPLLSPGYWHPPISHFLLLHTHDS
ncbi:uncharacterized protein LOC142526026 [Primulina tabacum]|uniref:uncharacterized protein LOC142526026 n=1 Tax=Primulina tabacum TaxID=48773 RepID=UPI003F5AA295